MKKFLLAIFLILCLSLTLVACTGNGNGILTTGEAGTKEDGSALNNPDDTSTTQKSPIENLGDDTEGGWSGVYQKPQG